MKIKPYITVKIDESKTILFLKKREVKCNKIISINEVGLQIINMIDKGYSIPEIEEKLSLKYEVDEKIIKNDVEKKKKKIKNSGLIESTNEEEIGQGSNIQYDKEMYAIQEKYKNELKPYKVFVEITYRCNLKCSHCYRGELLNNNNEQQFITKEIFFKLCDDLEKLGVIELYITGGEPFLHPDIIEMLTYASSKNMLVTVLTNGNILFENNLFDKIKHLSLYDIRFSIYGDEKQHDLMTKINKSYCKTFNALKKVSHEMGIGTAVYVLTKENFKDCESVIKKCKEENIKLAINPLITPTSLGNLKPTELRISKEEYKEFLQKYRIGLFGSSCSAGLSKFRVSPDGEVYPCEFLGEFPLGNLNMEDFDSILKGAKRQKFIKYFSRLLESHSCNMCENRKYCNFCPAIFKFETGSFLKPSKYVCMMSESKRDLSVKNEVKNETRNKTN